MNIAFIAASLANVGSISLIKDLTDNLTNLGHSCTVYYFDNKTELKFICKTLRISFWKKINFSNFDIIHSHCFRPNAYVFFHRTKRDKAKFLTTMHSYIKDDLIYNYNYITGLVFSYIWKILLSKQDLICCLSNNAKKYYQKILFKPKLEVVYSGRDISGTKTDIDAKDKELFMRIKEKYIIIGINAVLTRIKGIEQIINLLQRDSQFACVIIGDGKGKKELEALSRKLNVEDRCFFLGYRKEARRYLKFYDIYAMPSRFEGFPLALTEAVAQKVPCICSDIPIFKELYTDQEIVCFKLDDINDLEKKINIMKNRNTRKHLAERAFEYYSRYYTVRAMTCRYLRVYERIIG
jgi:L-malate glycosyltransferase